MTSHDQFLARLRRQIRRALLGRYLLLLLTGWCFAWGTLIVLLRVLSNIPAVQLLWGLLALPVLLPAGLALAWRRVPEERALRALVDEASACGGLLMAAEEQPLGGWQMALPPVQSLRIRWQPRRALILGAAAAAFVVAGLLLPLRVPLLAAGQALAVDRETERLAGHIELLKEEEALEQQRAESLQEELEQVHKEASAREPEKTFEALDHLSDLVKRAANNAAEKDLRQTEQLAKAETLADALQQAGSSIDAKMQTEAMTELAKLVNKAAAENKVVGAKLDPETIDALKKAGALSNEQYRQLTDALKDGQTKIVRRLSKLHNARLIDAKFLKRQEELCKCNGKKLGDMMLGQCSGKEGKVGKEGKEGLSIADMLGQCQQPGVGNPTRGRADAEMRFGEESSEQGVKFKEQALPPGQLQDLKNNVIVNLSQTAPQVEKNTAPAGAGTVQGRRLSGGSAVQQTILPRHRPAVRRYFDRPDTNKAKPASE